MIVIADCDFDKPSPARSTWMRFTRQGQSCTAASRIYRRTADPRRLRRAAEGAVDAMKMGDPLDETTDIGTIVSRRPA